mmetsp:Transcript_4892/g.12587  ORF Transcript_4892/g.12587 Transcript_4892/m.12587 type:complete len:479 (-) Transcript_4892:470-1906(-)
MVGFFPFSLCSLFIVRGFVRAVLRRRLGNGFFLLFRFGFLAVGGIDRRYRHRHPLLELGRNHQLAAVASLLKLRVALSQRVECRSVPLHQGMELGVGDPFLDRRTLGDSRLGRLSSFLRRHLVFVFPQLVPVFRQLDFRRVFLVVLADDQSLREGAEVARKPVNGQGRRHLEGEESDEQRQKLEHGLGGFHLLLGLFVHRGVVRFGWLQNLHGESLSENQDDRHDAKCQGGFPSELRRPGPVDLRPSLGEPIHAAVIGFGRHRSLQAGNPQERFVEFSVDRQEANAAVQSQNEGKLKEREEASRQRVLVGVFVQLSDQLVFSVLVVFEFLADFFYVRLKGFRHFGRLGLLETQRDQQRTDAGGEQSDGKTPGSALPSELVDRTVDSGMHELDGRLEDVEVRRPPSVLGRDGRFRRLEVLEGRRGVDRNRRGRGHQEARLVLQERVHGLRVSGKLLRVQISEGGNRSEPAVPADDRRRW